MLGSSLFKPVLSAPQTPGGASPLRPSSRSEARAQKIYGASPRVKRSTPGGSPAKRPSLDANTVEGDAGSAGHAEPAARPPHEVGATAAHEPAGLTNAGPLHSARRSTRAGRGGSGAQTPSGFHGGGASSPEKTTPTAAEQQQQQRRSETETTTRLVQKLVKQNTVLTSSVQFLSTELNSWKNRVGDLEIAQKASEQHLKDLIKMNQDLMREKFSYLERQL